MALDGEATYGRFYLIKENPVLVTPVPDVPQTKQCCSDFFLKVLADTDPDNTDPLRNDVSGFHWWFSPIATGATMTLIKGSETVATMNDDTYGTFHEFGFFVNIEGKPFIEYLLEWQKVLAAFGPGMYKVKCDVSFSIGGLTGTYYSPTYCLAPYSPARADGTVRVEYNLSGLLGTSQYDSEVVDRGDQTFYNAYRIPGYFGFPKATYEETRIQYNSGMRGYVTDFQEPEFMLQTYPIPGFLLEIIRTDVLQADRITITDYNGRNINTWVNKRVFKNGPFEPEYHELQNRLASVKLNFKQEINNLRKNRQ